MLLTTLLRKALLGSYWTKPCVWGLKDVAALHVLSHQLSHRQHHMHVVTLHDLASGHCHFQYSGLRGGIVLTLRLTRRTELSTLKVQSGKVPPLHHKFQLLSVPTVELLYDAKAGIGEGPFYEAERNQLLGMDISGCFLNFLDLETRENRKLKMSDTVSAVVPVEGYPSKVVALIGRNISYVDRETGAAETLATVDEDYPDYRLNDAKCDCQGMVWHDGF